MGPLVARTLVGVSSTGHQHMRRQRQHFAGLTFVRGPNHESARRHVYRLWCTFHTGEQYVQAVETELARMANRWADRIADTPRKQAIATQSFELLPL